jgi:ATP-dependent DNA helicase RecQ
VIVYCGTRRQTEEIASLLISEYSIGYYHAGLKTEERTQTQEDFSSGKIRILAATNAFGMGMDYPDVRLVVHFQMPANIESYYQEVGRGGRDGKDSSCLLMYSKKDKGLHTYFIKQSVTDAQITKRRWQSLDTIVQFMEGGECRHAGILTYFKDSFRLKACGHCDVCIPNSPRRVVPNEIPVAFSRKTQTRVRSSSKKILSQSPLNNEERVRSDILRKWRKSYADEHDIPAFIVFSDKTLYDLAQKAPKTLEELHKVYGMGPHKVEHLGKQILEQISIS